jgi:tRNA U34 5-methylaminomethyl-2-thiouridine-forming methyltransferase MnmC
MDLIKTGDGSFTLFSEEFGEHYHSTKDGAFNESYYKHVNFAFDILELKNIQKNKLTIFDSNFGLGFNTLTTVFKILTDEKYKNIKLDIYSTEIDKKLVEGLKNFEYPDFFTQNRILKKIIFDVSQTGIYKSENINITVAFKDTIKFLEIFDKKFDLVYQDAFSPKKCPELWSKEYFSLIRKNIKQDGLITTYSTASDVRKNIKSCGFNVFLHRKNKNKKQDIKIRAGLVASFLDLDEVSYLIKK